jgi:hypothetical protein
VEGGRSEGAGGCLDQRDLRPLVEAREKGSAQEARAQYLEREREEQQQEILALRQAVTALAQAAKQPDAPPGIDQALDLLAKGQPAKAEAFFAELVQRREAEGAAAYQEAAEAARHLGGACLC